MDFPIPQSSKLNDTFDLFGERMMNQSKLTLAVVAALAMIALPQSSVAGVCVPQITQVHASVCHDLGEKKTTDDFCQLHIHGECLEPFAPVVYGFSNESCGGSNYRVMIADGNGILKQANLYTPDPVVMGATDLHYELDNAVVNCVANPTMGTIGMMGMMGLIENRLVKLQRLLRIGRLTNWIDLDSKFVSFTCVTEEPTEM